MSNKDGFSVKVIADSLSPAEIRLSSLEMRYPRWIHAEFMTHRVFSRNAASSRAIPVWKIIHQVRTDPATPVHWGKNKPGMQASEELTGWRLWAAKKLWVYAAYAACLFAWIFSKIGLHKQVANRILEPFFFMQTIVTATEWDNFLVLRAHPDAQPEIKRLADMVLDALNASTPKRLAYGEWHVPYVKEEDHVPGIVRKGMLNQVAVARCARVSYLNHDGSRADFHKDMKLHDDLAKAGHFSPFEHIAVPSEKNPEGFTANFRGWESYRSLNFKDRKFEGLTKWKT